MAKKKEPKAASPAEQGSEKQQKKGNNLLFGLFTLLTAIVIIVGILGGVFYYIVHNNINGVGERYRKQLQGVPILSLALPPLKDPEDPKYLTDDQIKEKYNELRKTKADLQSKLDAANQTIKELQKYKDEYTQLQQEDAKLKTDMQAQKDQLATQQKQLANDTEKLNQVIASGDKSGFKAYFEKVDTATAQKIYTQVMQEQKASAEVEKTAKLYESMDPTAAAGIFEQMGNAKIDLTVQILKNMKKETASEIIASMTAPFASTVTEKLSKP